MMRLCVVASALFTASAGPVDDSFALGLAEGLLDGDGTDLALCITNGLLQPAQDGKEALEALKAGIHDRNLSEIAQGITSVAKVIKESHNLVPSCSAAIDDGKHIRDVEKEIHGIKEFFGHAFHDVTHDEHNLISKELSETIKAFKNKDYPALGRHMGTLLHRVFVETEFPNEKHLLIAQDLAAKEELRMALPSVPSFVNAEFVMGLLEGLLDDQGTDFALCTTDALMPILADGAAAISDLRGGLKSRNVSQIVQGLSEVAATVKDVKNARQMSGDCKAAKADASHAISVIKNLHGMKALLKHIGANVIDDFDNLLTDAYKAMQEFKGHHYGSMGQYLGAMTHRAIVGPFKQNDTMIAV